MDNDDNDYQGHGLHLAGEESSKHSPVLRPYALHKSDFDEGHLRFDSLVENEVFLGIPSQEDNQWIEDFSRGSSGIEFSSSAAETCSIPRHNNVWSEATSSESVEMLLKSVGQEEIVAGETITEESDAGDDLPSLSQPMDRSSSQDARADEIVDHSSELPPTEFLGSFTSLDPNPNCDVTRSNYVSQPGEVDLSAYGYSSSIGEKTSTTAEENMHVTMKCNESNVKKDHNSSLVECLNNKMQEDPSVSALETGSDEHSPPNIVMGAGQLNVEEKMSNVSHESIVGPQESPKMGVNSMPEKKSVEDDEKLSKISAEASVTDLHYAVHVASKLEAIVESALETAAAGVPESSSLPTDINSNLLTVKGCIEEQCSTEPAQSSRSGLVTSGIEGTLQPQGESILPEKSSPIRQEAGEGSSRGQIKEDSNHAIDSELDKEPLAGTSTDRRTDYLEISGKICSDASTIVTDASSGMQIEQTSCDEHANINGDNNVVIPQKSVPDGAVGAEVVTESSKSADGATEIHNDNSRSIDQISPSEPTVSSGNSREVSTEQALQDCNQDIPVQERDRGNFALDSNNGTDETAEPYDDGNKIVLSALDEVTEESVEEPHGSQFDAAVGDEPASNDKIEDTNTGSHKRVDDVPPLQVSGTTGEVSNHNEDGKSKPSALEALLPEKDDVEMEAPSIDASIPLLESRDAIMEKLSDSITKGVPDNSAAVVVSEDISQSLNLVESSDKAIQVEQAAAGLNQEQPDKIELSSVKVDLDLRKSDAAEVAEVLKPTESTAEKDHGIPSTSAGEGNSSEVEKPDIGSGSVIISSKLLPSGAKKQEGTVEGMVSYVPQPNGVEGVGNASLTTISPGKKDAVEEERSFTFNVSPLVGHSERETTMGWRTILSTEAVKTSTLVEGSPSTSGRGQIDSLVQEVSSHRSTQKLDKRAVAGGSKSASDRKTRRGSGKSAKENAIKGNHVKDTVPLRPTEKADTSSAFFSPSGTGKLMPVELGNVERSGTMPTGVVSVSGSSLPDLNMSTPPPILFHQPFTDLQQVQLRAQIFVYGSLIQGVAPDEACMVSAFGISDGGRSIWEPAWRAYMERLHGQKPESHPSNSETPVQSRSGAKALDKGNKPGSNQSKVRASSKSTPSPAINPMIPLSSPLWNVPTPSCDNLPTNNLARGAVIDYQALSPIHAYQTPALRNLAGHTSWVPQPPFPIPWVASLQSSPFDISSHFPALHTTETVKVTAVKESSAPTSSVAKLSSTTTASGGSAVSLGKSLVHDPKKTPVSVSRTPDTADPKSRKRKKPSGSEDLGQTSLPISQKVSVSTTVRNTPAVSKGPVPQDLGAASLLARSQGSAPQDLGAALLLARSQGPAPQDLGAASLLARSQGPAPQDLGSASLLTRSQAELVSASAGNSQISTSVVIPGSSVSALNRNLDKSLVAVSTISSHDHPKSVGRALEKRALLPEDIAKVAEAKLQAEEAAAHAAVAVGHCQSVWSELDKQKNSGLMSDVEAKLASAAVAIAAASSVAKAAAAAAKIASNAAVQAKQMADEALISTESLNPFRNDPTSLPGFMNSMGNATPESILKVGEGNNGSTSIIIAAREASRRRMEAASAASRHAENLDAVVKAAELAAEAVSQAGKIVALGEPLPLSKLAEAGPEGYWKITAESGRDANSNNVTGNTSNVNIVEEVPAVIEQRSEKPSDKEVHSTDRVASPHPREASRNPTQDRIREEECIPASVSCCDYDLRGTKSRRTSDGSKTTSVVPESEIGLRYTEPENITDASDDNVIKENRLVEVFKDNGDFGAWFSANVLNLKDGNALVCYTELESEEGKLKEWVPLESHGSKPPIIRPVNPITSLTYEGTRKRRRAAVRDHVWSLGDRVDAWMGSCWREGVIVEKNKKKDESILSVHFPVQGKISAVKVWHLRSTRIWKNGEWIELPSSGQDHSFQGGDTPQEKRVKLGSPAIVGKGKAKMSSNADVSEPRKPEESSSLPLSAAEKVFNVGSTKNDNKPETLRTMRSGLQKEGSKVIFGVPKPKRKFMEVSKHYTSDRSTKNSESTDSEKFAKYLMPQGSGARRAWKNSSKVEPKEKQAAEFKPRGFKSAKPPSVSTRTLPRREVSSISAPRAAALIDSVAKNTPIIHRGEGEQNLDDFVSSSSVEEGAGPTLLSSHAPRSNVPKKMAATNLKSERLRKGRPALAGGKSSKVEEKEKLVPEVVEPRRSNRKIQPTSRLLEGLQSSLIIPKFPPVSHDKSHRNQNKGASKGNN